MVNTTTTTNNNNSNSQISTSRQRDKTLFRHDCAQILRLKLYVHYRVIQRIVYVLLFFKTMKNHPATKCKNCISLRKATRICHRKSSPSGQRGSEALCQLWTTILFALWTGKAVLEIEPVDPVLLSVTCSTADDAAERDLEADLRGREGVWK